MMNVVENKRKELGIKVYDLANLLGIDASLMSRILSGKRKPTDAQLHKLAEVLSIDYREIIKGKLENDVVEILKKYPTVAEEVLLAAEERLTYLTSRDKFNVIAFSESVSSRLERLTHLQKEWADRKPLNPTQLLKMKEYFYTEYTYESNRIEGNTLDLQETHLVVNEGITIGGKSMKEHLEVINHQEAIHLISDLVASKVDFSEHVLRQIHQLVLKSIDPRNAGVYRSIPVRISGSKHVPAEPYMIHKLMEEYFVFYNLQKNVLHPVILAAEMHERLVSIHPLVDGNGRTSRLVMNLILLLNGYTIVNLKGSLENRQRYYNSLEAVQVNHESEDFYSLITEFAIKSLEEHIALAG